jgi:deoxyuridine 5'-triphosphate nucleotidohydrolase
MMELRGIPAAQPRVSVRIRRLPHAGDLPLPAYGTDGSAGLDVRAAIGAPLDLLPGAIAQVPTGFAIEVPGGYELQVRPRSGLGMKHGVTLPNSPATIDSDYRGEVIVALINHGAGPFRIERGMRVAQMVLAPVPRVEWTEVEDLSETGRGTGGFGHTGLT